MNNTGLIKKMKKDMHMRNFSNYTYDSYLGKTKDIMRYFGDKQLENVTTDELRDFLLNYLKNERRLSDRSINYYNSVIRFIYDVTLDKVINKKQLPMKKKKKTVYKVLTNSKTMRVFVREGKGNKERYTILSKQSLEMLRIYWSKCRQNKRWGRIFLSESGKAITEYVIRTHFRKYRKKANLNEKVTMHTLRHCFATHLIERGATIIQVKELMGHSNIRSTMAYIHVANIDLGLESPLDVFMKGEKEKDGENSRNNK